MSLTNTQAKMLKAVHAAEHKSFHKVTCEALEGRGLIKWSGTGFRLIGCNSFMARDFEITDAGGATIEDMKREAEDRAREGNEKRQRTIAIKSVARLKGGKVLCRQASATEEALLSGGGYVYFTEPDHRPFPPYCGRFLIDNGYVSPREDGLFSGMSQTFVVAAHG